MINLFIILNLKSMATKFKEYFDMMVADNKQLFEDFKDLSARYMMDDESNQEELNENGPEIVNIVREYEERLCKNTERGKYSNFSGGLAEKFQDMVRKNFPAIDYVGIKIKTNSNHLDQDPADFSLKRIQL